MFEKGQYILINEDEINSNGTLYGIDDDVVEEARGVPLEILRDKNEDDDDYLVGFPDGNTYWLQEHHMKKVKTELDEIQNQSTKF